MWLLLACVTIGDGEIEQKLGTAATDDSAATDSADDDSAAPDSGEPCTESTWYADEDGDGHGDPGTAREDCQASGNEVSQGDDCDDNDATAYPNAAERCDGADNDCDEEADEEDACVVDLGDADGRVVGDEAYSDLGWAIATLGDLDGNGDVEWAVSVPERSGAAGGFGVFSGDPGPGADLADAPARVLGVAGVTERLGRAIEWGADATGDGTPDVIVSPGRGSILLFSGPEYGSWFIDAPTAEITTPIEWEPDTGLGAAGDVNADGADDVIVAVSPGSGSEWSVLMLGPFAGRVAHTEAAATFAEGYPTTSAILGDVSGDGGAEFAWNDQDGNAVVFFESEARGALTAADAMSVIEGDSYESGIGSCIVDAGDTNGDGYDDVLLGAYDEGGEAFRGGAAYLFLGSLSGEFTARYADSTIINSSEQEYLGMSCSTGDVDGDGEVDVLLGAPLSAVGGSAYLLLGPLAGEVDVETNARRLDAQYGNDRAGNAVELADINLDGRDDILIGAPYASVHAEMDGAAYLVLSGE